MNSYIEAISTFLPANIVTNEDLVREYPDWNMSQLEKRSGVNSRHIADKYETALDLSLVAVDKLFSHNKHKLADVDAIIYCTQTPDYVMPGNSHLVHSYLKLPSSVLAFDFNLACSGYIYGLSIANSFIKSGQAKKVLLINSDTYSKLIHPGNRAVRVLFGDGCAASLISGDEEIIGFNKFNLATCGKEYNKFYVPAGGHRNPKSAGTTIERVDQSNNINTDEFIRMDGMAVWSFINSSVPLQIRKHLQEIGWELDAIDMFFFHQGSKMTLDSLGRALGISPDKSYTNLKNNGNMVSASIPACIRDYLVGESGVSREISVGSKVCLSGFGVGLSYGTTSYIYEKKCYAY